MPIQVTFLGDDPILAPGRQHRSPTVERPLQDFEYTTTVFRHKAYRYHLI